MSQESRSNILTRVVGVISTAFLLNACMSSSEAPDIGDTLSDDPVEVNIEKRDGCNYHKHDDGTETLITCER